MRPHLYDRDGNPMTDVIAWAKMFEAVLDEKRQVVVQTEIGDYLVSTVWLGIDYDFTEEGPPLIFETALFSDREHTATWRYPTEVAALAGHDQIVAGVRDTRVHHGC